MSDEKKCKVCGNESTEHLMDCFFDTDDIFKVHESCHRTTILKLILRIEKLEEKIKKLEQKESAS